MASIMNPGTACPQNILEKQKEEYFKANESKPMPVPDPIFHAQFIFGWNFARDEHFIAGITECPDSELLKTKALEQPLPRLPVEKDDVIEIFKMGVEAFFKVLKGQLE